MLAARRGGAPPGYRERKRQRSPIIPTALARIISQKVVPPPPRTRCTYRKEQRDFQVGRPLEINLPNLTGGKEEKRQSPRGTPLWYLAAKRERGSPSRDKTSGFREVTVSGRLL